MSPYFIVSTGRTGTNFLGRRLDEIKNVTAHHEPSPNFVTEVSRYLRWKNKTFRNTRLRNAIPGLNLWYRYKFKLSRLKKMTKNRSYLEANNILAGFLPELRKAFPESDVIFILRDPRETIRSFLNRGTFMLPSRQPDFYPFYFGEHSPQKWRTLSPFERASWWWVKKNRLILESNPELTLSFEKIFQPPHEDFERLLAFCELPREFAASMSWEPTNTTMKIIPKYQDWERDWKEQISPALEMYRGLMN